MSVGSFEREILSEGNLGKNVSQSGRMAICSFIYRLSVAQLKLSSILRFIDGYAIIVATNVLSHICPKVAALEQSYLIPPILTSVRHHRPRRVVVTLHCLHLKGLFCFRLTLL